MKPSQKELESITQLAADKRYEYFIKKVADWEAAWSLAKEDGWALYGDDSGNSALPIWPAKAFAELLAQSEWQDYCAKVIPLEILLNDLLPRMEANDVLVGVFPTSMGKAPVVTVSKVVQDIQAELVNY